MDSLTAEEALAALAWQVELGADEAILDAPVDRFAVVDTGTAPRARPVPAAPSVPGPGEAAPRPQAVPGAVQPDLTAILADAEARAGAADSLPALQHALAAFEGCELRKGARNLVFADGDPRARVMVIGEAPGRDEDLEGKPFVGRAGQLLDAMFAAIGLSRRAEGADTALYITNILPWRPPQNRDPTPEEIAMMQPFVRRHISLADPKLIVPVGNIACQGLFGRRGIKRLRGQWTEVEGRPAIPMFHPAYLLRQPSEKARSWADLLALKARLRELA